MLSVVRDLQVMAKFPLTKFLITVLSDLLHLTLEGEQFGAPGNQNYHKARIGLDFYFRSNTAINPLNQKVFGYYITASDLRQIESLTEAKMRSYLRIRIFS